MDHKIIAAFRAAFVADLLVGFPAPVLAQFSAQQTYIGSSSGGANAFVVVVPNINQASDLVGVPINVLMSDGNSGAATLTVSNGVTNVLTNVAINKQTTTGLSALSGCEIAADQIATFMLDGASGVFEIKSPTLFCAPTRTKLSSGSGTYTTPAHATWLRVLQCGAGGGGGGTGTSGTHTGGTGGTTTFGSTTAIGGSGGLTNTNVTGGIGGNGGTGGITGTGTELYRFSGTLGSSAGSVINNGTVTYDVLSGAGGSCPLFVGGAVGNGGGGTGVTAIIPGGGASGGGSQANTNISAAGGGGGGEGVEFIISAPASSYTYTIGAGGIAGTAGTNGSAGGVGAPGVVIVEEHYD